MIGCFGSQTINLQNTTLNIFRQSPAMYNNSHHTNHHQRHSNSSSSTRHLSPPSPIAPALVDRLAAPTQNKRPLESSDDDEQNDRVDSRSSHRSTANQKINHKRRRTNNTHHTTSNSDIGNSASDDSAAVSRGQVAAPRHPAFDDDDDSEDDDDDDDDDSEDDSDKVKSDKNKNVTLRKLFVINKSEGGKGGAKKQGQVMIIDHSEDVAAHLYQQQSQAVAALALASKESLNTLMPSPSAAAMAHINTPTKTGVSPKTDKLLHGSSAYNQKLSNNYRTSPLGQTNRVQPSPINALDPTTNCIPPLPRHLPSCPSGRPLLGPPIMCHISLARLTRIPPAKRTSPQMPRGRDSHHSKAKRSSNDLPKSPVLDSRRNLLPPPSSAYESRTATSIQSPSVVSDRLVANTVIQNSLSAIRHSPNDKSLSAAAATANHLKQIKLESLKTEFSSNSSDHLHTNSSNSSPSVARRTPQQTPGAMKQFDVSSTGLANDVGKMVSPLAKVHGVGFKREMLGIKAEYLKVPSNDEPQSRMDKDVSSGVEPCLGADEYDPGQRRKRAASVNSSPYKDKKRKKVCVWCK